MGEANVFNTFSFNKWAEQKKEEEIDKETKRRRHEQIRRLKEKLRKERALREAGMGDGDFDLELLIQAIQNGNFVNVEEEEIVEEEEEESTETKENVKDPKLEEKKRKAFRGDPDSDLYILDEVLKYTDAHPDGGDFRKDDGPGINMEDRGLPPTRGRTAPAREPEKWNYNRRHAELMAAAAAAEKPPPTPSKKPATERPPSQKKSRPKTPEARRPQSSSRNSSFKYNKRGGGDPNNNGK